MPSAPVQREKTMLLRAVTRPVPVAVRSPRPASTRTGVMLAILAAVVLLFSRPRRAR